MKPKLGSSVYSAISDTTAHEINTGKKTAVRTRYRTMEDIFRLTATASTSPTTTCNTTLAIVKVAVIESAVSAK